VLFEYKIKQEFDTVSNLPAEPGFPLMPGVPVAPVNPRKPVEPRGPLEPVSPTGPLSPAKPTGQWQNHTLHFRCNERSQQWLTKHNVHVIATLQLDGCIVWNEHNTIFGSKAICAQAVYFLHSMIPIVSHARDWVMSESSAVLLIYSFQSRPAFFAHRSARRHSGVVGLPNIGHRTLPKISVGRFLVRSV